MIYCFQSSSQTKANKMVQSKKKLEITTHATLKIWLGIRRWKYDMSICANFPTSLSANGVHI